MIDFGNGGARPEGENRVGTWPRFAEESTSDGTAQTLDDGWLLPFLLLSMRERDLYGSELQRRIEDLGFENVRSGEIYMILWKAEIEGLVLSEPGEAEQMLSWWRYGLTEVGEAYLEFLANSLESYSKEISVFFRVYEGYPYG